MYDFVAIHAGEGQRAFNQERRSRAGYIFILLYYFEVCTVPALKYEKGMLAQQARLL